MKNKFKTKNAILEFEKCILTPYTVDQFKELSRKALRNRLYVNGWTLRDRYLAFSLETNFYLRNSYDYNNKKYENRYEIYMVYDKETPISCFVVDKKQEIKEVSVEGFVRKKYRRNGIGSQILSRVREENPNCSFFASYGVVGSEKFWGKNLFEMEW